MQVMMNIVLLVQLLSALAMIGLVLVQHGKGADMGASFGGGGSSGSLFGATGSANFLSRSTAVCATVFFVCTLALAFMSHSRAGAPAESSSILERAASAPAGASAVVPSAATQIPGVASPAAVAAPASAASAAQ